MISALDEQGRVLDRCFRQALVKEICTGLVPLYGDPEAPRGGVSGRVIRDLYQAQLPELTEPGDIFMQDNARVHTARVVKEVLNSLQIEVMIWLPYSPDLNPIENLWSLMKKIYMLYLELEDAPNTEETCQLLILAAKKAW
jgi:transposase